MFLLNIIFKKTKTNKKPNIAIINFFARLQLIY